MNSLSSSKRSPSAETARASDWRWFTVACAWIVTIGAILTFALISREDRRMRDILQQDATLVTWAMRSDLIAELKGAPEDETTAVYQRIKSQLAKVRTIYPYSRFLYILRRDEAGVIRMLADSEPADSPDASPPGQTCSASSERLHRVFDGKMATTLGPQKDEWGEWVSAYVPLLHPFTDEMVALLGFDVDARHWRRELALHAIAPALFTAILLGLAASLLVVRRRRQSLPQQERPAWRAEVYLVAATGMTVTALLVYIAHAQERWSRTAAFQRIGAAQSSLLQQSLFRIGDNYLEGIARFVDSSNFVDRREFHDYLGYLLNRPYGYAWFWIPAVTVENLREFERDVSAAGPTNFSVWEPDESGARRPPASRPDYFPICYVEPTPRSADLLGLDLGSLPAYRRAMEEARATGQLTASDPLPLPGRTDGALGITVFRAVPNRDGSGNLAGFVGVMLEADTLLMRALSRNLTESAEFSEVALFQLGDQDRPLLIASNTRAGDQLIRNLPFTHTMHEPTSIAAPVFAFGHTYVLIARPASGYLAAHPIRYAQFTGAFGAILTALVTILAGVMANRRSALEKMVHDRTAELEQSEDSYRRLFNTIRQGLFILDRHLAVFDINDGAAVMTGYRRDELRDKPFSFLSPERRNRDLDLNALRDKAWAGDVQRTEFWCRREGGGEILLDAWFYKGSYFGREVIIAFASDISERKRAEAEHERLRSQFLQSQKMESVGRLAGGVAHDFNNMLQAIIGNTTLARRELPSHHPADEHLSEILRSAERSAALTRQLLAFASKQTIQPRVLNLNHTVEGMQNMLRLLIGERIRLEWNPGQDLWTVKVDPSQIDQILANLVVNARDAIKAQGSIVIRTFNLVCNQKNCLDVCTDCRPGEYVVLCVEDDGCGMDERVREHLFEPFFTTKEPGKGTGLGLATVFGIVNQNNGVISVKSSPGAGTRVHVMLPRITTLDLPEPERAAPDVNVEGRETILLVEDEPTVLRMGKISLERMGYRVLTASTPEEAIDLAQRHGADIDMLITDVMLPGMNGLDLVLRIVSINPHVRSLFMSGYTADVISDTGVLDESVNFIQKPFTISELAAKIRQILDRGPA